MQNKLMVKILLLLIVILFINNCKITDNNKAYLFMNDTNQLNLISEEDAKALIVDFIQTDPMYQQYYMLDSPTFDERVRIISWGDTILVKRIPNKKYNTKGGYYYIFTGVMPDGQVLAAQLVDAITGEITFGKMFFSQYSDTLRIITPSECVEYAKAYIKGNLKCEALYYFAGTKETSFELLTWRYLVQPVDADAVSRDFIGSDYVLIDPYIQNFKNDNTIKSTNGFLSGNNYFHRAFRIETSNDDSNDKQMVPID